MRTLLLGQARENSTRCKSKMVKPFAETTLTDLYLKLLSTLKNSNVWTDVKFAYHPGDTNISNIVKKYDIETIIRNDDSISKNPDISRLQIHHYLKNMDYDYVQIVNGCFPFLQPETIYNIYKKFIDTNCEGLLPVIEFKDWVFNVDPWFPISFTNPNLHGTQLSDPMWRAFHASFIFNRQYLVSSGDFFPIKKGNPYLHKIDIAEYEKIDIDTEEQFLIAEMLYE